MTGFGYDPSHSIVKARQQGLQTVLYKPFRADRLIEAVQQALRSPSAEKGANSPPAPPEDKASDRESPAIEAPVHES
jgi:DNA-binding NtrC family response regulator